LNDSSTQKDVNTLLKSRFIYCLIWFSIPLSLKSQDADSLYAIWNDTSEEDTIRLVAMENILTRIGRDNPDTAMMLVDLFITVAENTDLPHWKAKSLNHKGLCYIYKSDYEKANQILWQSIQISEEYNLKSTLASSYYYLGTSKYEQGLYIDALRNYKKSLSIREEIGDVDINNTLIAIGSVYFYHGDYLRSLEYFSKSLKLKKENKDSVGLSILYTNIGAIYFYQDEFLKAIEYYQKGLGLDEHLDDEYGISVSLTNIGEAYLYQGDYERSIEFLQRSIDISNSRDDKARLAFSISILAEAYSHNGNFKLAQEYYQKGYEISLELGLVNYLAAISVSRGDLFRRVGNLREAIIWCKKGLELAEENNILVKQKEACECLYESTKALGNGIIALEYHERFLTLSDSLKLRETQKLLQQMEFANQVEEDSILREQEKLEAKLAFQQEVSRQKARKNLFLFVGIGIFILAICLWFLLSQTRKSRAIIRTEKQRSENLLLNILPNEVADELKEKGESVAKKFDDVSVLFTDFQGFTELSGILNPEELVDEINVCYKAFDEIITYYNIEKIKTIGDAYMAAAGLHIPRTSTVKDVVMAGLDMQSFMGKRKLSQQSINKPFFEMRAGIHTGSVIAGVVGIKKFQYDIWGDTVNIASRIESSGEVGKVNISKSTYDLIKNDTDFRFISRGMVHAKSKGDMEMYFVDLTKQPVSKLS